MCSEGKREKTKETSQSKASETNIWVFLYISYISFPLQISGHTHNVVNVSDKQNTSIHLTHAYSLKDLRDKLFNLRGRGGREGTPRGRKEGKRLRSTSRRGSS